MRTDHVLTKFRFNLTSESLCSLNIVEILLVRLRFFTHIFIKTLWKVLFFSFKISLRVCVDQTSRSLSNAILSFFTGGEEIDVNIDWALMCVSLLRCQSVCLSTTGTVLQESSVLLTPFTESAHSSVAFFHVKLLDKPRKSVCIRTCNCFPAWNLLLLHWPVIMISLWTAITFNPFTENSPKCLWPIVALFFLIMGCIVA